MQAQFPKAFPVKSRDEPFKLRINPEMSAMDKMMSMVLTSTTL